MTQQTRKKLLLIAGAGLAATAVPLALLAPGRATKRQKAPFWGLNFAHRGERRLSGIHNH